jgi:hypothetical protein
MEEYNVTELVERLGSEEDGVRKMAVFKLQSNIGDPSFADVFIAEGGLVKLRYLALNATGNTLAYSLASFSKLLEVDKGWEYVNQDLVKRVCFGITSVLGGCTDLYRSLSSLSHIHWSTFYAVQCLSSLPWSPTRILQAPEHRSLTLLASAL